LGRKGVVMLGVGEKGGGDVGGLEEKGGDDVGGGGRMGCWKRIGVMILGVGACTTAADTR